MCVVTWILADVLFCLMWLYEQMFLWVFVRETFQTSAMIVALSEKETQLNLTQEMFVSGFYPDMSL